MRLHAWRVVVDVALRLAVDVSNRLCRLQQGYFNGE